MAGLRTAALASVVPVLILAALLLIVGLTLGGFIGALVGSGYTAPSPPTVDPASRIRDNLIGLLWLISIPGVTFLAVLDFYAMWPPGPEDTGAARRYAVSATLFSLFLLGGALLVSTMIDETIDAAARRDAEEAASAARDAETRAREARSAGLSIMVTVVDAELGARTNKGRLLSRLAIDVTVRSATDIELGQAKEARLWLYNPGYYGVIESGMGLPAHIPAGFETTYRLEVPTRYSCTQSGHAFVADPCDTTPGIGPPDYNPPLTGPWEATFVFSNDVPYNDPRQLDYSTKTDFTVADTP